MNMKLETRVFELSHGKYANLNELAKAMGISVSYIFRLKGGTRPIGRKFIIGAKKAFPEHKLDDLFYFVPDGSGNAVGTTEAGIGAGSRRDEIVKLRNTGLSYAEIGCRFGISRGRVQRILEGKSSRRKPDLRSRAMLTISDVAQFLGVHVNTVRRWSDQGMLKSYRIGSRGDRRFRREDVDDFLKKGEIK